MGFKQLYHTFFSNFLLRILIVRQQLSIPLSQENKALNCFHLRNSKWPNYTMALSSLPRKLWLLSVSYIITNRKIKSQWNSNLITYLIWVLTSVCILILILLFESKLNFFIHVCFQKCNFIFLILFIFLLIFLISDYVETAERFSFSTFLWRNALHLAVL